MRPLILKRLLFLSILIIAILFTSLFLAISTIHDKSRIMLEFVLNEMEIKNTVDELNNRINYLNTEIDKELVTEIMEISYEKRDLSFFIKTSKSNDVLRINDLGKDHVFFYFSKNHCKSCYENEIRRINKWHIDKNYKSTIAIITDVENDRQLELLKVAYKVESPIYRIISPDVSILPEYPTYFHSDNEARLRGFIVVNENWQLLAEKYFDLINK
jgi:hypothetical protein